MTQVQVLGRAVLLLLPREVGAHIRCPGTQGRWAPGALGPEEGGLLVPLALMLCSIRALHHPADAWLLEEQTSPHCVPEQTQQSSGGRAVPTCTQEPGRELLEARTAIPAHWGPLLASAHQTEEATRIKPPRIFQLSSFGVNQN